MKILYFDCFAGISGDMALAALIDAGVDVNELQNELNKLQLPDWELRIADVSKNGIGAKRVEIITPPAGHAHAHKHRSYPEIAAIVDNSQLSPRVKDMASNILFRLAMVESKIHKTALETVYFHEIGAIDSIIDIVGTAICIDILAPNHICASMVSDGYGFVDCQHGKIPIPAPAVAGVFAMYDAAILKQIDVEAELVTPTGAAIVAELSRTFGTMPAMNIKEIGYGAGTRDLVFPNLLRVITGEAADIIENETAIVIETNIDDTIPEILGYAAGKLLEAGAKDVYFTPIYMKKQRPASKLSVICDEAHVNIMEHIIFTETSAIGVRKYRVDRNALPRRAGRVSTIIGDIKTKEVLYDGRFRHKPEYDDAVRLAQATNTPLIEIYRNISEYF